MARKFGFLLLGVCLVLGALGFVGCETGGDEENYSLVGVWSSGSDGYLISKNTLTYEGFKDLEHPEWSDYNFTGTIKNNPDFTQKAGVIIVEYTKKPIYGKYNDDWKLTGGEAPTNSFMGIYWQELTTSSVRLANSYDSTDTETETEAESLDDAEKKFTQDNEGTLVNWTNVQPQTRQ
ncbi:MAG: hypothetical protein LBD79_10705 [Treponema sp.]|nr:hypothetical protein [Treponema sp.]